MNCKPHLSFKLSSAFPDLENSEVLTVDGKASAPWIHCSWSSPSIPHCLLGPGSSSHQPTLAAPRRSGLTPWPPPGLCSKVTLSPRLLHHSSPAPALSHFTVLLALGKLHHGLLTVFSRL